MLKFDTWWFWKLSIDQKRMICCRITNWKKNLIAKIKGTFVWLERWLFFEEVRNPLSWKSTTFCRNTNFSEVSNLSKNLLGHCTCPCAFSMLSYHTVSSLRRSWNKSSRPFFSHTELSECRANKVPPEENARDFYQHIPNNPRTSVETSRIRQTRRTDWQHADDEWLKI